MKRFSLAAVMALSLALAVTVQSATQPTGALNVPSGMGLELKVAGKRSGSGSDREATCRCPPGSTNRYRSPAAPSPPPPRKSGASSARVPWGKIANIEVTEGATTTLEAGPPFTLKTVIYKTETSQDRRQGRSAHPSRLRQGRRTVRPQHVPQGRGHGAAVGPPDRRRTGQGAGFRHVALWLTPLLPVPVAGTKRFQRQVPGEVAEGVRGL